MTDQPLTVRMGILTGGEFDRLDREEQVEVDGETQRLLNQYGTDFCIRERDRLRSELAFVYGCLDDPVGPSGGARGRS